MEQAFYQPPARSDDLRGVQILSGLVVVGALAYLAWTQVPDLMNTLGSDNNSTIPVIETVTTPVVTSTNDCTNPYLQSVEGPCNPD